MKEGVLKRITYPTKGYSEFDYETNQFNDGVTNLYAGGLRIKSILGNAGGITTLKRYEYSSDVGMGIGRLPTNWYPVSAGVPSYQNLYYRDAGGTDTGSAQQASFTQSGGAVDLNTMDAAPVYYTTVTEYFEDFSDPIKNGKNVYEFDFRQDYIVNSVYYKTRDVQPWKRGNLTTKTTYDAANNVVSSHSTVFSEYKTATRLAAGFVSTPYVFEGSVERSTSPCPTTFITTFVGYYGYLPEMVYGAVNYHTGIYLPSTTNTMSDNVTLTQNKNYNNQLQLTLNDLYDSRTGEKKADYYFYASDVLYSSDPVAQMMVARNMLTTSLTTQVTENTTGSPNSIYQEVKIMDSFSGMNARGISNNLLIKELWSAPKGTNLEKRVEFTNYSSHGKPLSLSIDGLPITLLWGYNNSLLLAEIKNATKSQTDVALAAAEVDLPNYSVTNLTASQHYYLTDFRNALPNSQVTWFTHRPHIGLTSIVSPNGLVSKFGYNALLRLQTVKDHGGNLTDFYRYNYSTILSNGQ